MNIYIVYEINLRPYRRDDFTVGNDFTDDFTFTERLVKNAEKNKYKYLGYGIGVNNHGSFPLSNGSRFDKNVIILEGKWALLCMSTTKIRIF